MDIKLETGTLETTPDMGGWIITSKTATVDGQGDITLLQGDEIALDGRIWRDGQIIAQI